MKRGIEETDNYVFDIDHRSLALDMGDILYAIFTKIPSYSMVVRSVNKFWKKTIDAIPFEVEEVSTKNIFEAYDTGACTIEILDNWFKNFMPISDVIFESYTTYMRKMYELEYPDKDPQKQQDTTLTKEERREAKRSIRSNIRLIDWMLKTKIFKKTTATEIFFSWYIDHMYFKYSKKCGLPPDRTGTDIRYYSFTTNMNDPMFWIIATRCTNRAFPNVNCTYDLIYKHNQKGCAPEASSTEYPFSDIIKKYDIHLLADPVNLIYTALCSFTDIKSFCELSVVEGMSLIFNWNIDSRKILHHLFYENKTKKLDKLLTYYNKDNQITNFDTFKTRILLRPNINQALLETFLKHCDISELKRNMDFDKAKILYLCMKHFNVNYFITTWKALFTNGDKFYLFDALLALLKDMITNKSVDKFYHKSRINMFTEKLSELDIAVIFFFDTYCDGLEMADVAYYAQLFLGYIQQSVNWMMTEKWMLANLTIHFLKIIITNLSAQRSQQFLHNNILIPDCAIPPSVVILVQQHFPLMLQNYKFKRSIFDVNEHEIWKEAAGMYAKDVENSERVKWTKDKIRLLVSYGYESTEVDFFYFFKRNQFEMAMLMLLCSAEQTIYCHDEFERVVADIPKKSEHKICLILEYELNHPEKFVSQKS